MKRLFFVSGTVLVLGTGCGGGGSEQNTAGSKWPEAEKKLIVEECLQDVRNNSMPEYMQQPFCNCMLEKIMVAYPDGSTARGSFDPHVIREMYDECTLKVQ